MKYFLLLLSLWFLSSSTLAAGDAAAGKTKAVTCIACHGAEGISSDDIWLNLMGQKAGYLIEQTKAYRDGERKDPMMAPLAQSLTDQDIEDIAAYYSTL